MADFIEKGLVIFGEQNRLSTGLRNYIRIVMHISSMLLPMKNDTYIGFFIMIVRPLDEKVCITL